MLRTALLAAVAVLAATGAYAQTVVNLKHSAPDGALTGFLLTDGTVLVQGYGYTDWYRLTPDNFGSYVNGTWARAASLPSGYAPDASASAVLADGRLLMAGGEYNFGNFTLTNICALYDPVANKWTEISPPKGWNYIGDSPATVLPNGHFLIGDKINEHVAELDPATLKWKKLSFAGKADFNAEEGWTLLPNGTVLTADVKAHPNSEIYDVQQQAWTSAGSTVVDLQSPREEGKIHYGNGKVYLPPGEIGPAILRPDGTVFATGGTHKGAKSGHTAIYTPPANGVGIGTWAAGPDFPTGEDAGDSFAVLLPSGNVLVEAESGNLYEFNGSTLTAEHQNGGGMLLDLPTGEVFLAGNAVYRPAGTANPAWAPTISSVAATLTRGSTYPISGTQFNGLSQAAAFGDEYQMATNYPLVRITNTASGHVFYARTHDHSSMGVATGNQTITTSFDVPAAAEAGASTLAVVANGIASTTVAVTLQ